MATDLEQSAMDNDTHGPTLTLVKSFEIPARLHEELEASNLPPLGRLVILWIAYQSLVARRDTSRMQSMNQPLLDTAIKANTRRKLMEFIQASKVIRRVPGRPAIAGEQSYAYEVRPKFFTTKTSANITYGLEVGWVGMSVDFGPLMVALESGWDVLGYERLKLIEIWGLACVDDPALTPERIRTLSQGETTEIRAAKRRALKHFNNPDARKTTYRSLDGRSYHSATALPREHRRDLVSFSGRESAECDVRACWPWLVAMETRKYLESRGLDCSRVDDLLALIEAGRLYSSLAEIAGVTVEFAKEEFARQCLFGRIDHGPLWFALEALCPEFCATIRYHRNRYRGKNRFFCHLAGLEGVLMSRAISMLFADGIPSIRIHDGLLVPRGAEALAEGYLQRVGLERFGRAPHIKVVVG